MPASGRKPTTGRNDFGLEIDPEDKVEAALVMTGIAITKDVCTCNVLPDDYYHLVDCDKDIAAGTDLKKVLSMLFDEGPELGDKRWKKIIRLFLKQRPEGGYPRRKTSSKKVL